ncbi:RHS repeat-associated core domain-containing protein, partial [Rhodanobacter koreensis]
SQALGMAPNGPGYTGHVNDPDTGLVYMQARYYDPATGRFLSVDPVTPAAGNTFNFSRYTYADNNPVVNIDPDGRMVNQDQETSPGGCTGSLTGGGCGSLHLSITQVASPSVTEQKKNNAQQAQQTTSSSSAKKTLTQAMKDYVRSGELTQNIIIGSLGAITTMQGGDEDDPIPGEEAEQAAGQQMATVAERGSRYARGAVRKEALDKGRGPDGAVICSYCGKPMATTVDHVVPWAKGGSTTLPNLVPACISCNSSKGAKDLGTEWIPPLDREHP